MTMLVSLAAVTLLAGCTSKNEGAGNSNKTSDAPVKLVFYSGSGLSEDSFNELYGKPIMKKFPNITTEYIRKTGNATIESVITGGNVIDVYFESIGGILDTLVRVNLQLDMTELMKRYKVDLNEFEPTVVEAIKTLSKGNMYGLPIFNTNRVLYYNKDLFNRFGVPYPKDGMSWDEAIELGNKMTRVDNDTQYLGLSSTKEHHVRMNSLSVPFVDPVSGKAAIVSDPKWKLVFSKGFVEPYRPSGYLKAIEKSLPAQSRFYKNKDLAMFVALSNMATTNPNEMADVNWDMVAEPFYKELPGVSGQTYPTFFSVTSASTHKEQAMQAIAYLASVEHQSMLSEKGIVTVLNNPEVKKKLGQGTTFKDKNFQAIFYNKLAPVPYKTVEDYEIKKYICKVISSWRKERSI